VDARIKFRHLSCFLEVARQQSVARAADVLCITQPAVSKTIKELEGILEVQLFERSREGSRLLPAGMVFQRYAGTVIKTMEAGMDAVKQAGAAKSIIRVGVLSTVEAEVIPEAVKRAHKRHDGLIISVTTGPSSFLLSQLRVGELELVVGRLTEAREVRGLSFEQLYSESMLAVVRPGHPLIQLWHEQDAKVALNAMEGFALVLPSENTIIREYADQLFIQHGLLQSPSRLETLSPALSRRYTLNSDAIWVAPASVVQTAIHLGELVLLPVPDSQTHGAIGICTNSAAQLSIAGEIFCDILREVGNDICSQGAAHFNP